MPFLTPDPPEQMPGPRMPTGVPLPERQFPTGPQITDAAFRQDNTVVNLASRLFAESFPAEPDHNPLDTIRGTKFEQQYLDNFLNSRSERETRSIMARIETEEADRRTLDAAGFSGFVAQVAAGTLDPTIALPGGVLVKSARGGYEVGRTALSVGVAAGGQAILQEGVLQATLETRTAAESAGAVATGAILGGLIGAGAAKLLSQAERKAMEASLDTARAETDAHATSRPVDEFMPTAAANDDVAASPLAAAAGAAATDTRRLDLVPFGPSAIPGARVAGELLAKAGGVIEKVPGGRFLTGPVRGVAAGAASLVENLAPTRRVLTSESVSARRAMADLAETPYRFKDGEVGTQGPALSRVAAMEINGTRVAVSDELTRLFSEYRFGQPDASLPAVRAFGARMMGDEKMTWGEFKREVAVANQEGDAHPIPQIAQAAQFLRQRVFEPYKKRAIAAGLLPEDVEAGTAQSYFMRSWNKSAITERRPEFVDTVTNHLVADQAKKAAAKERLTLAHGALAVARDQIAKIEPRIAKLAEDAEVIEARREEATRINKFAFERATALREGEFQNVGGIAEARPGKNIDKARGGAVFETKVRSRGNELADRVSAKLAEIDALEQQLAREIANHDAVRAKIETEIAAWEGKSASEAKSALKAREKYAAVAERADGAPPGTRVDDRHVYIDGVDEPVIGFNRYVDDQGNDAVAVGEAGLPEAERGRGRGVNAYMALINDTFARGGKNVVSDSVVSPDAARIYAALERRGYQVQRAPDFHTREDGSVAGRGGAFRVVGVPEPRNSLASDFQAVKAREKYAAGAERGPDAARLKGADDAIDRAVKRIMESDRDLGVDELRARAHEITDRIVGSPDGRLPYDIHTGGPEIGWTGGGDAPRGPLAQRDFMIPDAAVRDYLNMDAEHVAAMYMRTMVPDVLLTERFGDTRMTEAFKRINEDYAAKTDAAKTAKERARLESERQGVIRDMAAVRDRLRSTYGWSPDNRNMARVITAAKAWNNLTSMGVAAISSIPDMAGVIFRHGLGSTMSDGYLPFVQSLSGSAGWDAAKAQWRAVGIGVETTIAARQHAIDDVMDAYHPQSKAERALQSVNDKFFVANLLSPLTDFEKLIAANVASAEILRAAGAVAKGKATSKQIRMLADSNIDTQTATRIWAQFDPAGVVKGGAVIDGVHVPNTADWKDQGAALAFNGAVARDVDIAVVTPGQEKPLWMSRQVGSMLGQFKSFTASATERILIANLQKRDAQTLQGLIFALGLGMLSYKLNSLTGGQATSERPQDWIKEGISRGGLLGWFEEGNALASKATRGTADVYRLIGADKPLSRFASRSVSDMLLGPTVAKIEGLAKASGAAATGDWQEADTKAVRRLLATQNMFYLRSLFDQVEAGANNAFGIEMKAKP